MSLFRPSYLKNGPGIEKETPPKQGLLLFCEIIAREFWQLIKVNLLFLITALPLVTFGAARGALARCTMLMVQDRPNDVWQEFREQCKRDWKRQLFFGLLELFAMGVLLLTLLHPRIRTNPLWLCLTLLMGIVVGMFFSYLWPLTVTVSLPVKETIKNACLLPVLCLGHSIPALFINACLLTACFILFPLSLPFLVLLPFGIGSFVTSFVVWLDIQKYIMEKKECNDD